MNIINTKSKDGAKEFYSIEFNRRAGGRIATGIYTYTYAENQQQKNHNKDALRILEIKTSEMTLEHQAAGTGFIPTHKFKENFFYYYQKYVNLNKRYGNRHLEGSLLHFKNFIKKEFIAPVDINETLCKRFRQYLLDQFTGETPMNYFARFKWVVKAATKEGYYRYNPAEDIRGKTNPSKTIKANLEIDEYLKLLETPCYNEEVKEGFIFSCYTGLRYVDVYQLKWEDIKENTLATRSSRRKLENL